jgi:uncharacterized protein YycO
MGQIVMQFAGNDTSLGSKAIEWFSHSKWSHVDTVMPGGSLLGARSDVIQGIPAGVQIRPANYVHKEHDRLKRVHIPCADAVAKAYYDFVLAQVGKPYDKTAIFAFIVDRNWEAPDSWFCSELCSAAAVHAKLFTYKLAVKHNKIDPGDLLFVLSAITDVSK